MQDHEDLYEILQVHPSAEPDIIQAAHRHLALRYHPDRNHSPMATYLYYYSIMTRLQMMYTTLTGMESYNLATCRF